MRFRSQQPLRHPSCSKPIGLTQRGASLSPSEITAGRVSLRLGRQKPAGCLQEGHGHKPALRPGDCSFWETCTCSPHSRICGQGARTARDASHPPKPCSLLGLVPLRVSWPLKVLHVACMQLGEEGEVALGGWWPARPHPTEADTVGPLPLSPEACLGSGSLAPPAAEGSGVGVSWRPRPVSPPPGAWDSHGLPSFREQDTESQPGPWRPT